MFSIPLSINFFPSTEFIAIEPMFNPNFASQLLFHDQFEHVIISNIFSLFFLPCPGLVY